MKSAQDPRHLKRIAVFKSLFAGSFTTQPEHPTRVDKIQANIERIDDIVQKCAPEWPISQINRVDLAVLRQAIYELLVKTETPTKVIIDEAVEIAKRYGGKTSSSFVNGALASAINLTGRSETSDDHSKP
ncbi:TPA: transcription antitermination factor NusB [Candidatus Collierbacteria bacterium]|uniref:N utilization substance protein B-like protein n=1 Tax=Candidatus Collierbacteria bacterium GW2011_GWA2_42_17 TaxID=1618378 RepID=A0A0G0Z2X4_9BACT|nr:MAG: N utilization substance protein B-like protein [Candidatus Collierbacteria bacterium GW2011_GWB2_42_12]KKS43102.1 MAG: N utilization substance protein B-like protein [Candidatus Collierbacteria bacterium GW2011_GWA2_42_17]KKS63091.1 MAG: N utilization substance protein B-like protein [Candidatus Collierbacteria bacterium GW2011_GWE2_42_48]KKS63389.1 MAG: N utilization substance protein B-like protein [Candidatus Collierbacteria bacterium GW2011_GWD2_42_50]KKS65120.1 MAG: N utilization s